VDAFFAIEKPRFVILTAAMVSGIYANNTYLANFIAVKPRHLGGPPQGAPRVVRPPLGHVEGGRPTNGVASHPYNFRVFFFFFLKEGWGFFVILV
jgi:hypothetical protein